MASLAVSDKTVYQLHHNEHRELVLGIVSVILNQVLGPLPAAVINHLLYALTQVLQVPHGLLPAVPNIPVVSLLHLLENV